MTGMTVTHYDEPAYAVTYAHDPAAGLDVQTRTYEAGGSAVLVRPAGESEWSLLGVSA